LALQETISFQVNGETFYFPGVLENRYIIGNKLDAGGFGTVFDCQDVKTLD
jgi:serine/threonine protein kinase